MQILIDIPEEEYEFIIKHPEKNLMGWLDTRKALLNAVIHGTPLPKGHGRLIDEQIISDYVNSHIQELNTGYGDLNSHTNRILRMIEDYIDNMPTVIPSDKEEQE